MYVGGVYMERDSAIEMYVFENTRVLKVSMKLCPAVSTGREYGF